MTMNNLSVVAEEQQELLGKGRRVIESFEQLKMALRDFDDAQESVDSQIMIRG